MITILTSAMRPLSTDDGKEGVNCKLYNGHWSVLVIDGRKGLGLNV